LKKEVGLKTWWHGWIFMWQEQRLKLRHIILEDKVEQARLGEATSNEAWWRLKLWRAQLQWHNWN
jgi:hypothetical protein